MAERASRKAGPTVLMVPEGDNRLRHVCAECGFIDYRNPLVVVGSVCRDGKGRILMCRRAIDPGKGYWTIPAGFLELGETAEAGARREAMEEANAEIVIDHLLAVYNIPRISQVQLLYAARLVSPRIAAGSESLEVALFAWDAIPWDALAFPSVAWALRHSREALDSGDRMPRGNPPDAQG